MDFNTQALKMTKVSLMVFAGSLAVVLVLIAVIQGSIIGGLVEDQSILMNVLFFICLLGCVVLITFAVKTVFLCVFIFFKEFFRVHKITVKGKKIKNLTILFNGIENKEWDLERVYCVSFFFIPFSRNLVIGVSEVSNG